MVILLQEMKLQMYFLSFLITEMTQVIKSFLAEDKDLFSLYS